MISIIVLAVISFASVLGLKELLKADISDIEANQITAELVLAIED